MGIGSTRKRARLLQNMSNSISSSCQQRGEEGYCTCAQRSHPPYTLILRNRSSEICHWPGRGPPNSPYLFLEGVAEAALYCAHRAITTNCPFQARSLSLQGWGLIDLPLRASNEHLPGVRVARAQEIIRLHPSHASSAPTGPRRPTTSLRPSRPAAPTRPSTSICSIIRAARG